MNVYIARAIRGDHQDDDSAVFKAIQDAVKRSGHKPQFEIGIPPEYKKSGITSEQYIYRRDILWLDKSQALIAEVSNASTGVGYEIAYARHALGLPTLCMARKNATVSAMITGSFEVVRFLNTDELAVSIGAFLALVEDGK